MLNGSIRGKHIFALYVPHILSHIQEKNVGDCFSVQDKLVGRRIKDILRLKLRDTLILFDGNEQVYVVITAIKQSLSVECCIEKRKRMVSQRPSFVVCLPLLKKKAFERACYAAVELGATEIVLVATDKSSLQRITQHELERLRGIMITAAEQSKSFCIPVLTPCQPLSTVIQQWHQSDEHCTIYADQAGKPLYEVITLLRENTLLQKITVMIGPEGDLTEKEKEMVRQAGALFCSLTPTILRSHQALSVLLGALKASL